jgi:hypothetical protein
LKTQIENISSLLVTSDCLAHPLLRLGALASVPRLEMFGSSDVIVHAAASTYVSEAQESGRSKLITLDNF